MSRKGRWAERLGAFDDLATPWPLISFKEPLRISRDL
jgi:hypothetical protein